jgi:lysine-specific permease
METNVVRTGTETESQQPPKQELKRSLKVRHMNMIAIGGAIGTGLFVASGASVSTAGPGGAFLAYLIIGIMVYFIMTSLGEMATLMPISGSFATYSAIFVDPAFGFGIGWNYWFSYVVTVPCELTAANIVMKYWFPDSPDLLWSALFLAILFLLNYLSARAYGEAEFWFAGIKVATCIIFLIVGVLIIIGIIGGHATGMENWHKGDAPFVGGFLGMLGIFMIAGFSFQGTEIVGIAAGESEDPERNVPKAINTVFWRIMLFYIGAIIVISFVVPYDDPNLLNSSVDNVAVSPFTLVFERAGFALAASLMNAVILTSVLSCGNSSMYVATRMLYALAMEGKAPRAFKKVNSRGVPLNALLLSTAISTVAFLSSIYGNTVYTWLINASGMSGFITWVGIAVAHYRFRKAYILQGRDLNALKYKAIWYPFGPIFAFVLCVIVILGQNWGAFSGNAIDWNGAMASYCGLPMFLIAWLGYKFIKGTKLVDLKKADFSIDKLI